MLGFYPDFRHRQVRQTPGLIAHARVAALLLDVAAEAFERRATFECARDPLPCCFERVGSGRGDHARGQLYWTQKGPDNAGLGRISRANIEIPKGESAANRSDIEVLFDRLPEPIDLELDLANRVLYWTDRGDPPRGNTVNRAPIDIKAPAEILVTHLMEGIGIALDIPGNRMFVTDFAGSVYSADLDGKNERNFLYAQGNLTGIAYAEI